jgi:hypothetical protein
MVYNISMNKLTVILSAAFLILLGSTIQAATQPPTLVHLGSVPKVQISDEEDLPVLQLDPNLRNATFMADESLCIYTSAEQHNYSVTIEGNNGTQYALLNGSHVIAVELWWSSHDTPEGAQQLHPDMPLAVENGTGAPSSNCPNGLNANLQFQIHSDQLAKLPSGSYTGTFDVVIAAVT